VEGVVGGLVAALLGELPRADACTVELSEYHREPAEWRITDARLDRDARELLEARGWRSAVVVPASDGARVLIVGDRRSARRWSAGDAALCRLAAALVPPLEFSVAPGDGVPLSLLVVEVEPAGCDPLPVLRRCAGAGDVVGRIGERGAAIALRGSQVATDFTITRIERELRAEGADWWWFGFAEAGGDDTQAAAVIRRARLTLNLARNARRAAYHGCLPPRPLDFG
jgi:hypothetical protein